MHQRAPQKKVGVDQSDPSDRSDPTTIRHLMWCGRPRLLRAKERAKRAPQKVDVDPSDPSNQTTIRHLMWCRRPRMLQNKKGSASCSQFVTIHNASPPATPTTIPARPRTQFAPKALRILAQACPPQRSEGGLAWVHTHKRSALKAHRISNSVWERPRAPVESSSYSTQPIQ